MRKKIGPWLAGIAATVAILTWIGWFTKQPADSSNIIPWDKLIGDGRESGAHWSIHLPWPQSGYAFVAILCAVGMVYLAANIIYCSRRHIEHKAGWVELVEVLALLVVFTLALMHMTKW